MIRWQLHLLWPLAAVLLALAAFALYVFAHSDRLYRLKLALIPAVLAAAAFSFAWFGSRLGYAFPAGLPSAFEYMAHKVILLDNRKAWIDVVVVSRKPLERDARLHRVPWSEQLEAALKQASRMRGEGALVEVERRSGDADAYPDWAPRRVLPQDVAPKEPLPGQTPDLLQPSGPMI